VAYLKATTNNPSSIFASHCSRMSTWLLALSGQIGRAIPPSLARVVPLLASLFQFVDGISEGAKLVMGGRNTPLTVDDAFQVQHAIVSRLVTGRDMPPCRLSIVKTLLHPSMVSEGMRCPDPDCNLRECKGNRVEVLGGEGISSSSSSINIMDNPNLKIRILAPHHKTEFVGQTQRLLDVTLPPGKLTNFFLFWIYHGWHLISDRGTSSCLFLTFNGASFRDSTFCHYWRKLMASAPPSLPYFPPNLARTSFVESFTEGETIMPITV
jgi:hypothetical protein